ncbi:MAG: restriction endonuclease subunit S [Bacteroidaceae bacterium]|nr:restriction endonuclease subunit S [Bacteroidaceae bacterium]
MEEWKEYKAIEFCMTVTDGTHDSPKPKAEGYYLITSKHLKDTGIDFSSANFISEEDYLKVITRSKVEQYDILYSMIGTIGNIVQVKVEHVDFAVKNMGIFKMGKNYLRSSWLFYWLKSPYSYEYVSQRLAGSTQSYLTLNSLREFPVLYPGDYIAGKIVSILKSLDDKIEVNRRINDNLEQQAQALFKSWFVDFEPFKDGEFVESELGMIPKGWRVGTLSELGEIVGGSTPSKAKAHYYTKNGIAWLTPKDLSVSNCKFTAKGENDITQEGYDSCSAKIMPKGSVLFSSRAPIGYITIAKNDICTNQGFKSVVPKLAGTAFIYYFLKFSTSEIENKATGSTFKEASGSLMKSLPAIVPTTIVLHNFEELMKPIFKKQEILEDESRRLSSLRDTLLPRLMSGELKINDISV